MQLKKIGALAFVGLASFGTLTACSESAEDKRDAAIEAFEELGHDQEQIDCQMAVLDEQIDWEDIEDNDESKDLITSATQDAIGECAGEDEVVVDENTTGEDAGDVVEDEEMTEEEAE